MKATIPYIILFFFWFFISPNNQAQENHAGISSSSFVSQIPNTDNTISSINMQMAYNAFESGYAETKSTDPAVGKEGSRSWAEFLIEERIPEIKEFHFKRPEDERNAKKKFKRYVTGMDTVVQLNIVNVFGDYIELAGISIDSTPFFKGLDIEKRNYASLNSDIFPNEEFEQEHGRPYFDLYSTPDRFLGGYNTYGFIHTGVLNSMNLNIYGMRNAMVFGVVSHGNSIEVSGNLNDITILQR